MGLNKKQIYLKEILERKFHSELCTKDEADLIICLLKENRINTDQLEHDYVFKFEDSFELIGASKIAFENIRDLVINKDKYITLLEKEIEELKNKLKTK